MIIVIRDQVVHFIEKTMQTWRLKLDRGKDPKLHIPLSPLLFVIAMMLLNHILRECTAGFKLRTSQENIDHLIYMDAIKHFAKNEK